MNVLDLKGNIPTQDLQRMYRMAPNKRTAERLRAIYLRAEGKTPPQIATILGRHVETVRKWIKLFNENGPETLKYKHTGGWAGKLSGEQEQLMASWLKQGQTDGSRWTLGTLSARLLHEFGIQISQQQISERIQRLGLGHLTSRPRHKDSSIKGPQLPRSRADSKKIKDHLKKI